MQSYRAPKAIFLQRQCSTICSRLAALPYSSHEISALTPHFTRCFSSAPFFGSPLPPSSRYTNHQSAQYSLPPLSLLQRLTTLIHSSITAFNDPTRADAVAAVGEVTGSYALSNMKKSMQRDEIGSRILRERPLVDDKVAERAFGLLKLYNEGQDLKTSNQHGIDKTQPITFGAAYATFLQRHNFDPNERTPVRFLSDPDLSYVMTRYRQCHDYWHVLTGLPPTVLGELALKWLELMQTGLPLAALSATGGSLRLSSEERDVLWNVYFPWAIRVGGNMKENGLMCVYYEEEMETELSVLRERIGVESAPIVNGL